MKFKNPLDYVKNIINKFKELVNYPYKKKVYTGILIILLVFAIFLTPICFLFSYMVVPNENNKQAVAGIMKELTCYPAGFKHGPYCRVKFDNYFFKFEFTDGRVELENGEKKYLGDLLKTAYYGNKCVFVEYYNNLVYKLENCNGQSLYELKDFTILNNTKKVALYLGFFFLILSIFLTFLLNKEYKKEINQNFSIKDKKWEK